MPNNEKLKIGVDIGGTNLKFGIVNREGKILAKCSYRFDKTISSTEVVKGLGIEINKFLVTNKIDKKDISGIGIGCPGSIDSTKGICDYSNNLKFNNVPLVDLIEKTTGLKAKAANDANVACLGEARFGSGKNYQNIVFLTLGTGVGGGLVLNKKIYEGKDGKGAELGHSIIELNGRKCTCGRRGCLETYASATALIKDTKEAMKKHPESHLWNYVENDIDKVGAKTAFSVASEGDKTAIEVVNNFIYYLGEGILNFINIFKPDIVLLGGGVSYQGDSLINPLNEYIKKAHYGFGGGPKVSVAVASLGNDAGIIGASCLID